MAINYHAVATQGYFPKPAGSPTMKQRMSLAATWGFFDSAPLYEYDSFAIDTICVPRYRGPIGGKALGQRIGKIGIF